MTIHIQDTAVAAALERAIGHIGPYSDDELANVRELRIVGAGSLGDLARCSALEQLAVIGSDVTDLGALSDLKQLRRLSVLACPVTSAEALAGLERLEDLRLDFTFVEDASPLFALPSLRRARLVGNPWSETSQTRLEQHGLPASARTIAARPIFELGGEFPARGATRRLRGVGLDLCFGVLDVHRGVLVRPGKARLAGQECDSTSADAADVWLEDKGDCTTDSLFDAVRAFRTGPGDSTGFDFDSHRELGDRDDALRWIAAETDAVRRGSLERFIARFPGAVFFREDDAFHAMAERRGGISLPASYRNARAILAGAFPERSAEFRVDRFEGNTIAASSLLEEEVWYRPQFESYENDEGPTIRDVVRMYPFAVRRPQKRSILAVSLEGDQPEIREYRETDIFFALRSGDSPGESVYSAYPSYAELLGHIIAFKLADGVIEAAV
jgi:hypothetical protein